MVGILERKEIIVAHLIILIGNIVLLAYGFDMNKKVSLCSNGGIKVSPETERIVMESFKDFHRQQNARYERYLEHQAGVKLF